jgi:signal transduction histidine kinase
MPDTPHRSVAGPAPTGPDRQHNVPVTARTGPPPRWTLLVLPVVLPALIAVLLALTVALDVSSPATGPGVELAPGRGWPYALLGLVLGALATVILLYDVRQRFGWVLAWFGLFWVLDGLSQAYVRYAVRDEVALAGSTLAAWFLNRFGAFLPATVAVLLLIFPTGRFLAGRWGGVGRVVLGAMLLAALAVIVSPATQRVSAASTPPGFDLDAATLPIPTSYVEALAPIAGVVTVLGVLLSMVSVVVRYRRSEGLERDRMRWLLWAVVAMAVILALTFAFEVTQLRDAVILVVAALPAVAMTVAIVSPRVVPVEDLVGRTLVYGLLSLILVLVDLAVLAGLTELLGDSLDQRQVVLTVLVLTAALYAPLRLRLSLLVRRLMLGDRANPYDAVSGLASTLETADEGTEQLAAVARAVASAFGVGYVSVEVERSGGERLVAAYGERPAETRTLPITYRDTEVGRLVLPARGLRSRLSRRDEQLLGDLVRQAAAAARSSRMAEELQVSRERLVVAREEERRRIRRDLHDGLGPALSGVVFRIESARLLVERDPEAAQGHLAATTDQVKDVVADVRRLVHDLRPPALDDRGLVGAIGQLGESLSLSLRIETDGLDDGVLPAAAEVAAYRIAAEALTNVARHAGANEVLVRIEAVGNELALEVTDDGRGIDVEAQAGVGLLSLRERAAELGGVTEVACPPGGGTVVRARLPIRRPVVVDEPVGEQ